jgi:hypothetical protein
MVLCALSLLAKLLAHMTIIPQGHSLVLYRGFRHRNIEMYEPRVYRIPDIPIPDTPLPGALVFSGYTEVHVTFSGVIASLWLPIEVSVLLKQEFHHF